MLNSRSTLILQNLILHKNREESKRAFRRTWSK